MELADWCDATVNMVEGRSDPLELAAVAAAARFWWLQNRVTEVAEAATRMATVVGDPGTTCPWKGRRPMRCSPRARCRRRFSASTTRSERYGSENPTWWTAQVAILLVMRGGLDDSSVAPVIEQIGSPVLSAQFIFARAVPLYLAGDIGAAVELARTAAVRARAAGATLELATTLAVAGRLEAHDSPTPPPPTSSPPSPNHSNCGTVSASPGVVCFRLERSPRLWPSAAHHEAAFVLWGACAMLAVSMTGPSSVVQAFTPTSPTFLESKPPGGTAAERR